jgi:hypothetical protein
MTPAAVPAYHTTLVCQMSDRSHRTSAWFHQVTRPAVFAAVRGHDGPEDRPHVVRATLFEGDAPPENLLLYEAWLPRNRRRR